MKRRKLPIGGIQTFSELRNDYGVYVDKTMHIHEIASRHKAVFLARPRRFGKSLYSDSGKKIVEIGVVFSREDRNIIDWEVRK